MANDVSFSSIDATYLNYITGWKENYVKKLQTLPKTNGYEHGLFYRHSL